MKAPQRIQLRRTKGWRKPDDAVVVARPSRWGNPFRVIDAVEWGAARDEEHAVAVVVASFRLWLAGSNRDWMGPESNERRRWMLDHLNDLRGHDLACWCPLDQPCHADVLLELANGEAA